MISVKSHVTGLSLMVVENDRWKSDFTQRTLSHEYETNKQIEALIKAAPAGAVVVDAGAHVGDTGLMMASLFKHCKNPGKVIEIDPDRTKLDFIDAMVVANNLERYVTTVHAGLSDKVGSGNLCRDDHPGAWYVQPGDEFQLRPLDSIMAKLNMAPYFIKLDVEGYEVNALRGSPRCLRTAKYVMVEMGKAHLERNGHSVALLDALLNKTHDCIWKDRRDALYMLRQPKRKEQPAPRGSRQTRASLKKRVFLGAGHRFGGRVS
jgi:FkbM family methyltransferase